MKAERMSKDDLKEVGEVFLEVFNATGETWEKKAAEEHVKQNYFDEAHWVVREEGKIIGFLIGMELVREKGYELFVDSIGVLPEKQGQGIGSLLWKEAEKYVAKHDLTGIRLLANPSLKSYKWYESMGFECSGWVELHKTE